MEIQIHKNLVDQLTTLATTNSTTPEEYAANVVNAHLTSALRKSITDKIEAANIEDLAAISPVVATKVQELNDARAAELASPPIENPNSNPEVIA